MRVKRVFVDGQSLRSAVFFEGLGAIPVINGF